jgi:hypothetical protein
VIERLLDITQNRILVPVLLVMGLAWAIKALFDLHQWRGQNRMEFLDSWEGGDKGDDVWLEVVVRHLIGNYLPASIIRTLLGAHGKVEALLEVGQVWPLLRWDEPSERVVWRKAEHNSHGKRFRRRWAHNVAYFIAAYAAVHLAMAAMSLPPTAGLAWMLGMMAFALGAVALRFLVLADNIEDADKLAPRWVEFLNARVSSPARVDAASEPQALGAPAARHSPRIPPPQPQPRHVRRDRT